MDYGSESILELTSIRKGGKSDKMGEYLYSRVRTEDITVSYIRAVAFILAKCKFQQSLYCPKVALFFWDDVGLLTLVHLLYYSKLT